MDWSADDIRRGLSELRQSSPSKGSNDTAEADQKVASVMEGYWQFYGLDLHRLGLATQTAWLVQSHNYDICVQQFKAKNELGKVLVLHGYYDHVGLYKYLIRECLELGFSVTAFDLPGHGLSTGERASIDSFDSYQDALVAVMQDVGIDAEHRWSVIGQSTGGAVLIDFLTRNRFDRTSSPFANVVLLAPLVRPVGWLKARVMLTLLRPFVSSIKRAFSENSHDQAFLKFIRTEDPLQHHRLEVDWVSALELWIPDVETRAKVDMAVSIIQGTDDQTVDWRHNVTVLERLFDEMSVYTIDDGRHHLVCESLEYREKVFAHLRRALSIID
jgi:alpha-beta hydrolase superfamily lysophospholipase